MTGHVVAIDLGATSGRVMLGTVADGRLTTSLIRRFANDPVVVDGVMRWDLAGLYDNAIAGLCSIDTEATPVLSIGIDSWAVDYGLMAAGCLTAPPRHYRDGQSALGVGAVHELIERDQLFNRNGLQFLPFNTVYQLMADKIEGSLADVDAVLLIPDLIAYWMTGAAVCEETNASTTGLLEVSRRAWDRSLLQTLGLNENIFAQLVSPGDQIGEFRYPGGVRGPLNGTPVVAVGSHDTASAVAAVPMNPDSAVYVSCGTWGLVGVELDQPVLTAEAQRSNFTNERGVDGTTRFLHNVMGLWLLNECVKEWEEGEDRIVLEDLLVEAASLQSPVRVLDVSDHDFMTPGNMNGKVAAHLKRRSLPLPSSPAETTRLVVESLAVAFASSIQIAGNLAGVDVETVHIVGGGAMNQLLCQLVADKAGVKVVAGPAEATAMGNMLIQARTVGLVDGDLAVLREIVRSSCELTSYLPRRGST